MTEEPIRPTTPPPAIELFPIGEKRPAVALTVAYLLAFYAAWSCYILLVTPHLGHGPLFLLLENVVKLSLWTVPVLILVRFLETQDPLAYLGLRENIRRGVLYGLLFGCLVAAYLVGERLIAGFRGFDLGGEWLIAGFRGFDLGFAWSQWIGGVLLIGVTEEVVFRGFILRRFLAVTQFRWANLITSLLFVLVHVPRWIRDGQLASASVAGAALYIFAFSCLQGYVLKKSGSLWSCFLVHSIGNLVSFALGGGA